MTLNSAISSRRAQGFFGLRKLQVRCRARKNGEATPSELRQEFRETAPFWCEGAEHVPDSELARAWRPEELKKFPRQGHEGSAGLDPKVRVHELPPELRVRVWAYLRQMNPYEPSLAAIFSTLDAMPGPQKLRVKELFESCDIVSALVMWWLRRPLTSQKRWGPPCRVLDAACGHGLVGMMLAHCFPDSLVRAVDLEERTLAGKALEAWAAAGRELANFQFVAGDLNHAKGWVEEASSISQSLVVAVHACNEATLDVLQLAEDLGSSWAVVPCCMRRRLYFPGSTHLEAEEHYPLMCGALSARFGANMLHSIDRTITTKNLIVAKKVVLP
ncbi:unnamed protein product [Effrenium voratum]|uniref:Methyltransferase domain-containing protein n=1 Tax=Effrenium voratum TaxID=2562239 RepID=A0AA36NFB7_9DINO|nr:unnamed protein product [Effrenium voratum]CAJ1432805.1 unnamed protein product [Effrenium voratum]